MHTRTADFEDLISLAAILCKKNVQSLNFECLIKPAAGAAFPGRLSSQLDHDLKFGAGHASGQETIKMLRLRVREVCSELKLGNHYQVGC